MMIEPHDDPDQEQEVDYRQEVYNLIQSTAVDELEGSVLLGYAVVAEWQSPNGHKWLTKLSGDSFATLPPWRERMFGNELANWQTFSGCNCDRGEEEEDELL